MMNFDHFALDSTSVYEDFEEKPSPLQSTRLEEWVTAVSGG